MTLGIPNRPGQTLLPGQVFVLLNENFETALKQQGFEPSAGSSILKSAGLCNTATPKADDLIVQVTNMRVMTKPDAIGMMRSGHMKFHRYQTSDIRIRVYNNAAVVTGRLKRTRSLNDRDVDDNWRFTKVYIRREAKWQVVAWHASTIDQ